MPLHRFPSENSSMAISESEFVSQMQEELFDQEGVLEDVIAVDFCLAEEDTPEKATTSVGYSHCRPAGFPPLSPNAALKDMLTTNLFDHLWNKMVSCMRPLLMHDLIQTRAASISVNPSCAARTHHDPCLQSSASQSDNNFTNLLHISVKELQQRDRSAALSQKDSAVQLPLIFDAPSLLDASKSNVNVEQTSTSSESFRNQVCHDHGLVLSWKRNHSEVKSSTGGYTAVSLSSSSSPPPPPSSSSVIVSTVTDRRNCMQTLSRVINPAKEKPPVSWFEP